MKKLLLLAVLLNGTLFAYAQQDNEPAYVLLLDAASGGVIVCEFAENGTKTEGMEILEPFIQDGKLYFVCTAFAVESGNLKPGFAFTLSDESQIKAAYQGQQNFFVTSKNPTYPNGYRVAGFSENGNITVTTVFLSNQMLNRWLATVKLADF
jgi:hypothetical protein